MIVPTRGTEESARQSPLTGLAFVTLWATGPDPALDGIFKISALCRVADTDAWRSFTRLCNPFSADEGGERESAVTRMVREFGITPDQIEAAASAADVWAELIEFLGAGAIVTPDAEVFTAWHEHLTGVRGATAICIGPADVAGLFLPGRLAAKRADMIALLTDAEVRAHGPDDLRRAMFELARRVHAQEDDILRFAALAYARVHEGLVEREPRAAARLLLVIALLDRPALWAPPGSVASADWSGRIVSLARDGSSIEDCLAQLQPRCAIEGERYELLPKMPPDADEPLPFVAEDMATLDAIFEKHLPAAGGRASAALSYRPSQHQVSREVARSLGNDELLLVHAPTGTGKTLAYLVPTLLWSRRYGIRVGIATYTRALQEQALDREVPRALALLAETGVTTPTFVSILKGRENYVCWRALKHSLPDEDGVEAWFAWTVLAVFALTDADGDLDRLPLRPPLALESSERFVRALQTVGRTVRGHTGCCMFVDDRATCAAEVARKRAETSHVVIINQAFALARQDFFKHIIFDECEHLHEQAHSAWSRGVGFRDIRGVLSSMRQPDRARSRALLDRVKKMLIEDTPSGEALASALEKWEDLKGCVDEFEVEVGKFVAWRTKALESRVDREEHSMLREFVLEHDSEALVQSRRAVGGRGNVLDAALAALIEHLEQLALGNTGALRRSFDRARTELNEIATALQAWLPIEEGKPKFRPSTFYDVERDMRGDTVLAARVLLPNEFLGRNYYPELKTGVFLSATTWLQDGFGAARAYLGLDRAERPADEEEREPSRVRTFRAPDVFDYSRVLIAIPRDAPAIGMDKDKFLDYVRRFVGYLGERTRGRMLVLFTNSADTKRIGEETTGFFRARRIPLWFQNMEGSAKEELSDLFRSTVDSVLYGVDTFWYGADYPGETLEYLVIVRLPYGVPDRYHHAQCAAIGVNEQRRQIYLPRALAKFRQGFGRLMRREGDRGCVFVLDGRIVDPRHRFFLRELPIHRAFDVGTSDAPETSGARMVRGDTDHCVHEALAHMNLLTDVKLRGLDWSFHSPGKPLRAHEEEELSDAPQTPLPAPRRREPPSEPFRIASEDLPF